MEEPRTHDFRASVRAINIVWGHSFILIRYNPSQVLIFGTPI